MGCGEFLVKYILFFANLFFALAGLTLLGVGIAVQLKLPVVTDFVDGSLQLAPISAMVVGGVAFLIAFFGCCGAIRESNCMLISYSICMLVLMIAKLALAVTIFVKLDSIVDNVPQWLSNAFSNNIESFHEMETALRCCGTTGAVSYLPTVNLPASCCEAGGSTCTIINSYPGCNTVLSEYLSTFGIVIGSVAISVAAVELVGVIFGLCLASHARNKFRRSRY